MYHPPPAGPYYGTLPQNAPYPYIQYPPQAHSGYPYVPPTAMTMPAAAPGEEGYMLVPIQGAPAGLVQTGQDFRGAPIYGHAPQDSAQPYQPVGQIAATAYKTPAPFSSSSSGTATPVNGAPSGTTTPRTEGQNIDPNKRKDAIFHMLCAAEAVKGADLQDPLLSDHGKQQCTNLKGTFPYINDVQYVFCSPMYRSMQTVDTAFKERLNEGGVAKAFPWSELRNCAMTDEDQEGLLALPLNAGHTLDEIKKQVANRPFFFAGELMQAGWETKNKTDEPKDRHKRADEVRSELNKFAQVAIYGGYWKGIQITPYTGPGDVHIVVVSHNNFLNVLTHRSALPNCNSPAVGFDCVQYRSYHFPPAGADGFDGIDKNKLYEIQESKDREHIPDAMSKEAYAEKLRKAEEARKAEERKKAEAKRLLEEKRREEARRQEEAARSSSSGGCC